MRLDKLFEQLIALDLFMGILIIYRQFESSKRLLQLLFRCENMREKPTCRICFTKFTRAANMRKHMADIHQIFEQSIRKPPSFDQRGRRVAISEMDRNMAVEIKTPTTALDKSLEQFSNVNKLAVSAVPYMSSLNVKNKIAMYEREIANIKCNYWIIPNNEIHGLSGYFCRRCNSIQVTSIRDIGYDKTMQARHTCDEEKVKSIKMVSIRPSDVWHSYDFAAGMILDRLNYLMPERKYLLAVDISKSFDFLKSMDTSAVKLLLGIPDRYYLYPVVKDEKIPWLERVMANLGTKTIVDEFEIRDFLRRAMSSYAIFEKPTGEVLRRLLIRITT